MFEGLTCVYRSNVDLFFYVIGSSAENEVSALLKLEYMSVSVQEHFHGSTHSGTHWEEEILLNY